jgi:DNA-binding transcriptional LysR family regulator
MDRIALMQTFVRLVERGSFSGVARELGTGQATISRRLQELESGLGATLLKRTTRRLSPTDVGAEYYGRAKSILTLFEEAQESVRASQTSARGQVRLTCTSAFGILFVCRMLFAFQNVHSQIRIDLGLSDERVDLIRADVDLAIRLGTLPDSSLLARKLGDLRRVLVASPEYLARHGVPRRPSDLSEHNGIRFAGIAGSEMLALTDSTGRKEDVSIAGNFQADHALAIREAYLAGCGLGPAHYWLVADLIEAKRLQIVLPEYRLTPVPLHLLMVPGRNRLARVRLLVEFIAREMATVPGLTR